MRRVVVTGMGLVTPLGVGVRHVWERLIAGASGVSPIEAFDVSDLPCKVAGQVPLGSSSEGKLELDAIVPAKERRRMDAFIVYALAAAREAVEDSGYTPTARDEQERAGVTIGSGIGGMTAIHDTSIVLHEKGARRVSPFFIPSCLVNEASGHVSMRYGFRGPNTAPVTACATGAHAIGDASRLIQYGDADVMVAGGAEAAVNRLGIAGFCAMRAMSTKFNGEPQRASRPWDRDRDGFVMGEGAGVVVLEELEHAKARGATIYAEVLGYGLSGDAHHISAPDPEGDGAFRAMRTAIRHAHIDPEAIDYINAHATSTPVGDPVEITATKRLLGSNPAVSLSSTKSAVGHLLGAAGAVETIFSILALKHQIAPPTLNLDNPSDGCDLDLVPKAAKERRIRYVLNNSFGFGGTNAALVLGSTP